jgi:hypothetical protein
MQVYRPFFVYLLQPRRILFALVMGLGLWQCDVMQPNPPPFHRLGVDTAWESQDTVIQSVVNGSPTEDTLWHLQSTALQPGPGGNSDLDSVIYSYDVLHFQVRGFTITRTPRLVGTSCKTDSGVVGATALPTRSECVEVTQPVGNVTTSTGIDTLWTDTTLHVVKVGVDLGPRIGPMPSTDTLRATVFFPEQNLPPLTIDNKSNTKVTLVANSWPGTHAISATNDTLQLVWPKPAVVQSNTLESLGWLRGTLATQTIQRTVTRNFSFNRVLRGLANNEANFKAWWQIHHGLNDVPATTAFAPESDYQRFGMNANPIAKDSILQLRSRFSLRGNFSASVKMVLPPQSDSGCLLSWLFAAADEQPFILYEKAVKPNPAQFTLLASAAGFFVNTTGKLNPPMTTLRTETALTSTWKGSFPKEAVLTAQRRAQVVTMRICNLKQDTCTALVSEPNLGDAALAQDLQMLWTVGGFGKQAFQVLWSDFILQEGTMVLP